MNYLDSYMLNIIKKTCKGKKHIKLTVGILSDEHTDVQVFNESGEIAVNEPYIYEIGSITKTFTASLFSKFLFEKKISLDDSIKLYINGLGDENYYPILRRLLTHSSGYPARYPPKPMGIYQNDERYFFGWWHTKNKSNECEF